MFFCLRAEGRRERRRVLVRKCVRLSLGKARVCGPCTRTPGIYLRGGSAPSPRPALSLGEVAGGWPRWPPLNKGLFLPGRTQGLATSCSASSSECPAGPPWTHSGLLSAPTPAGRSQCGPVLPTARPPAPREEPVPASGTRAGCSRWFPGSRRAVCGRDGHPCVGSPLRLGSDLLRAEHLPGEQASLSLRRAGPPWRWACVRAVYAALGGRRLLSKPEIRRRPPPWTRICRPGRSVSCPCSTPHVSVCLVSPERKCRACESCLSCAGPSPRAQRSARLPGGHAGTREMKEGTEPRPVQDSG